MAFLTLCTCLQLCVAIAFGVPSQSCEKSDACGHVVEEDETSGLLQAKTPRNIKGGNQGEDDHKGNASEEGPIGDLGGWISSAMGSDVAADLDDDELFKLCAAAASDSYSVPAGQFTDGSGGLTLKNSSEWDGQIQWALYDSPRGSILALMGTNNPTQLFHDVSIAWSGPTIRAVIAEATKVAESVKPDYVTGHSLGGLLAECVTSYTGIPGVAFAAPGPVGTPNLADGGKFDGVPFKVIADRKDGVARTGGRLTGWQSSHIVASANIKYVDNGCTTGNLACAHSMSNYAKSVGLSK